MSARPTAHLVRRAVLPVVVAAGTLVPVIAGAAPAAAGAPQVVCSSARARIAPGLARDITAALGSRRGTAAVALYDRTTGTRCTLDASRRFDSASTVKVTVLAALLRQAQEAGRSLTSREVGLTTAMITKSDNAATTALWNQLGVGRVRHFLSLAGMTQTTPGTDGYWGLTRITAGDELKLMALMTSGNTVLGPAARAYALGLMSKVVPAQRWGVPAGTPSGVTVHVKNGWLSRATHGWRVHSVGAFTGGGRDYAIVVLTQDDSTMAYGVATIEAVARVVHRDLDPRSPVNALFRRPPPPVHTPGTLGTAAAAHS
ncbi:serine hydrolase [Actinacidiphila acidipaludis]|uniref:Beta-lactamase n=1 Tax=Actinacidiphila acidipaludis TaxID=2873382 RepID=A0ABS7QFR3_9ACTN|nr:serine hydrolase [Streptomyces acidipaludis]MBY8882006.1 class A beta-lactamase-related serine hydrolase [Streptomyces acidipaludis]